MSHYTVYVTPRAWDEMKNLPGTMRQRVRREIGALAQQPRPSYSRKLDMPDFARELRRLRLDRWRVVYVVTEADRVVDVIAVRKRPPYDYGDLATLLADLN